MIRTRRRTKSASGLQPPASGPLSWRGCIQVYTGLGKGKTTAALGLALRAAGAGLPVYIGQFMKGRETSELAGLRKLGRRVKVERFGSGKWVCRHKPDADEILRACQGLRSVRCALASGRYRVVILDEVNCALHAGLLAVKDILRLLRTRPPEVEVVLTGRNAPKAILRAADLVTEMREVKHYFRKGVPARTGIEM